MPAANSKRLTSPRTIKLYGCVVWDTLTMEIGALPRAGLFD
jgi:hypothetical protein